MTNNRISNFSDEPIIDDELHKNIISVLKKQDLHISQQHFDKILAHFAPSSKVIIKSTSHDILGQEKVSNASVNIDNNNINEMKKLIRYIPDFQPLFKMYITLYELQKILHDYPKFQKK
ncbi:Uncharacterised protein [Providencia rettgeri]|nr:Uncharacterised protein [Providencia rettgeri]